MRKLRDVDGRAAHDASVEAAGPAGDLAAGDVGEVDGGGGQVEGDQREDEEETY